MNKEKKELLQFIKDQAINMCKPDNNEELVTRNELGDMLILLVKCIEEEK